VRSRKADEKMPREFNILATTSRGLERAACFELKHLLEQVGDPDANVSKSGVRGVIVAKTVLDPFEVVKKLREILVERPYEFRYMLRIIPIEAIVTTGLTDIASLAKELSSQIAENETFRITVEKRFTTLSSHEIIEAVAANIKRKVNLQKPNKVMLIEVLGKLTGVSAIKPEDVISVMKEKML
jgi:tRNA acetyltransferase TAN1